MHARIKAASPITSAKDVAEQVAKDLDAQGCAMIEGLITPEACDALAGMYPVDGIFRSRVVMGRHGFGRGEYKSFSYPRRRRLCGGPLGRRRHAYGPRLQ